MAIAAWGPWAAQRRAAKEAEAKLQKAVDRFNEQKGRLAERNEEIQRLQARIAELEQGPTSSAGAPDAPPEAAQPAEGTAQPDGI